MPTSFHFSLLSIDISSSADQFSSCCSVSTGQSVVAGKKNKKRKTPGHNLAQLWNQVTYCRWPHVLLELACENHMWQLDNVRTTYGSNMQRSQWSKLSLKNKQTKTTRLKLQFREESNHKSNQLWFCIRCTSTERDPVSSERSVYQG